MVISGEKGGATRDLNGMATEISHCRRLPDLLGSAMLTRGVCVSRLWAPGGLDYSSARSARDRSLRMPRMLSADQCDSGNRLSSLQNLVADVVLGDLSGRDCQARRHPRSLSKPSAPFQVSLEAAGISGNRPDQIQDHRPGFANQDKYFQVGLGFREGPGQDSHENPKGLSP